MFFANQEEVLESIQAFITETSNNFILLRGAPGSGKTFVLHEAIERLSSETINCVMFSGDSFCRNRDYYYFYDGINKAFIANKNKVSKNILGKSVKKNVIQASKMVPIAGNVISSILEDILGAKKSHNILLNSVFNSQELEILFQLEYLCNRFKKTIFFFDDLHYADNKSLQFIYLLLTQISKLKNILPSIYIVGVTSVSQNIEEEAIEQILRFAHDYTFHLKYINREDYASALKALGLKKTLNTEMHETLYSITDGHLQLIADIVNMCNENEEVAEKDYWESHDWSSTIRSRILQLAHDGEIIDETLKYASLFGNTFLYYELELVLGKTEGEIRRIIDNARNLNLVQEHMRIGARFVHDIIRKSFRSEITEKNASYFSNYAKCLQIIHPNYYAERAESLFIAGEYAASVEIWGLFFLQQIRNRSTSIAQHHQIQDYMSHEYSEFLDLMGKAYQCLLGEDYQAAKEIIDSIEELVPVRFRAEKCYLFALICSKWLDRRMREEAEDALYIMLQEPTIIQEAELWERLASTALVASIHNNNTTRAKEIEKQLYLNLGERIAFDSSAEKTLNVLRRKSSCLHPPAFAALNVKKSLDFFGPPPDSDIIAAPRYHNEYYMALCNYVATTLMAGKFDESAKGAKVFLSFIRRQSNVQFPRIEMPLNNCVIALYLANEASAEESVIELMNILETIRAEVTTSIVINVNLAILKTLCGDVLNGQKLLQRQKEVLDDYQNVEFYYSFLVKSNLAVLDYILGRRYEAQKLTIELAEGDRIKEELYFLKRNDALQQVFNEAEPNALHPWLDTLLLSRGVDSCWNYYGRKLLFGELEFWSES